MTNIVKADLLSSLLWDRGYHYTFGLCCDGEWCVFHYAGQESPICVASGLTIRQVVLFLKSKYREIRGGK